MNPEPGYNFIFTKYVTAHANYAIKAELLQLQPPRRLKCSPVKNTQPLPYDRLNRIFKSHKNIADIGRIPSPGRNRT